MKIDCLKDLMSRPNVIDITGEQNRTGVYFLVYRGEITYVGQSVCVPARLRTHVNDRWHYKKWFDTVYFLPCKSKDLNKVEAAFIRKYKPADNGKTPSGMAYVTRQPDGSLDAKILQDLEND